MGDHQVRSKRIEEKPLRLAKYSGAVEGYPEDPLSTSHLERGRQPIFDPERPKELAVECETMELCRTEKVRDGSRAPVTGRPPRTRSPGVRE